MICTRIPLAIALATLAAPASEVGIGLSVRNDSRMIHVPMNLSATLRLEGSLSLQRYETTADQMVGTETGTGIATFRSTSTDATVGLALFRLKPLGNGLQLYYGPRVTYGHGKSRYRVTQANAPTSAFPEVTHEVFGLSALLGAEFFASKSFSLSGEVGLAYSNSRNWIQGLGSPYIPGYNPKTEATETVSALIARYYF